MNMRTEPSGMRMSTSAGMSPRAAKVSAGERRGLAWTVEPARAALTSSAQNNQVDQVERQDVLTMTVYLCSDRVPFGSMEKADFLAELSRLEKEYQSDRANVGSYQCEDCEYCSSCMF